MELNAVSQAELQVIEGGRINLERPVKSVVGESAIDGLIGTFSATRPGKGEALAAVLGSLFS